MKKTILSAAIVLGVLLIGACKSSPKGSDKQESTEAMIDSVDQSLPMEADSI